MAIELIAKIKPKNNGSFPIILGIVAMYIGVPDFPATDPLTAAAVGGASGLAATGMDQVVKQLKQ